MTSTIDHRPFFPNADVPMMEDEQGRVWFFPADPHTFEIEVLRERFPGIGCDDLDRRDDQLAYAAVDTNTVQLILRDHVLETIERQWGLEWLQAIGLNVLSDLIVRARDRKDDTEVTFLRGVADGFELEVGELRRQIADAVPA